MKNKNDQKDTAGRTKEQSLKVLLDELMAHKDDRELFLNIIHPHLDVLWETIERRSKMPEKKCLNCVNMDFCAMRLGIIGMASLLNINLKDDMAGDPPVIYMLNTLAHDCKRFQHFEGS